MRDLLIAVLAVLAMEGLGCVSAPRAKQPDESRRTPVNAGIPAELRQSGPTAPQAETRAEMEWR